MFLLNVLQFFEAADKPGGGSAGSKDDGDTSDFQDDGHKEMFGDDSVDYDELIKEDNPPAEQKKDTGESADDKDQSIEGTKKDAEEASPETKDEGGKPESKEEEKTTEPGEKEGDDDEMFLFPELGENEISRTDIVQAVKSFNDLSKWRTNLTQRSQLQALIDKLPHDEQASVLERLRPIISGKEAIPKGIDTSKPIKLKSKDDEGYESEVELAWDSPQVQDIGKQIRLEMEKEYSPLQEENTQLKGQIESSNTAIAEIALNYFLANHPNLEIRDDPSKQSVMDAWRAIELAGEDHPRIGNKMKLENLMSATSKNKFTGPDNLERAYKLLYGEDQKSSKNDKEKGKSDAEKRILEDQKKKMGLGPGEGGPSKDEEDKWLDTMKDPETEAHNELIGNALKQK